MSDDPSPPTDAPSGREPTTIPMVAPALITRPFATLLGALCFGVWLFMGELETCLDGDLPALAALAPLAVALVAIGIRKLWIPSRGQSLVFDSSSLVLRRSSRSGRSDSLSYGGRRTAVPLVVRRGAGLVIDTSGRTDIFAAS